MDNDYQTISKRDPDYPNLFNELDDPPSHIFLLGDRSLLDRQGIAIIGSRYASREGQEIAFNLGQILDKEGYNIVSGLAMGIDTAAHKGSLSYSGSTTAILPSGFNQIMPEVNQDLAKRISMNGLLLSEYPPQTTAEDSFYKARDRLQAALSDVVIVIETEIDGGTMHTVRFSKKLSKKVIVIDYDHISWVREGNEQLLSQGMDPLPVTDIKKIFDYV